LADVASGVVVTVIVESLQSCEYWMIATSVVLAMPNDVIALPP